ncbi:MAG: hypothetical protein WCX79_00930 [Candidatus Paceibacterota bacterium]
MLGSGGYLIDLGIENVPGVTTAQAKFYYNIISIALVMWLAWVADEPSSAQFCVIGVGISAFCAYVGWFTTPNPVGQWGLIIMCAVLAVILYMTEKKRFLYGINGAGDPLINILVFVLLMQSTIGLINGTGIFTEPGATVASPADCANGSVTFTNCAINGNLMLTNIQTSSGTNNVLGQTFSAVLTVASMGWNLLVLIIQLLVSVSVFGVVIYNTYPWIKDSPLAMTLVGLLQLGIWLIYMLVLFRYVWKPMPQDGRM